MKRLERLASIAFVCVLISLIFHLLGMSFNRWKRIRSEVDSSKQVDFAILSRCYQIPILSPANNVTLRTEFCVPNQWITSRDRSFASECLQSALDASPHLVCAAKTYNQEHCRCDYRSRTKAVLALTILVAMALGAMLFISHGLSQIQTDRILRWLVPVCFSLLTFIIISLIVILFVAGTRLHDELTGLEDLWTKDLFNETERLVWQDRVNNQTNVPRNVKVTWCFGMEILSLQFGVVSLVLYALMFVVKQRPEN